MESELTKLTYLDLSHNQISDYSPVEDLGINEFYNYE